MKKFMALLLGIFLFVPLMHGQAVQSREWQRLNEKARYLYEQGMAENRYQFYSEDFTSAAAERLNLEHDLRGALSRDEIFPVYQPQIELATGRVIGAEALMRWNRWCRKWVSWNRTV